MKRHLMTFAFTIFIGSNAQAQQVITTSGSTVLVGERILEYSVGQIVTETIKSSENIVTQGLLQPSLKVSVYVNQQFDDKYWIKVFPNPTKGILNISSDYPSFISYSILDIQGRVVKTGSFQNQVIDLSSLSSGTYFVNIHSKDISKSLKVIKQ